MGSIYVGFRNGIYALSAATGTQLWRYQTTNSIRRSPCSRATATPSAHGDGHHLRASRDRKIYKISGARSGPAPTIRRWPTRVRINPATVGQAVTFDGSGSHDPDGDPIVTYTVGLRRRHDGHGRESDVTRTSNPSPAADYIATLVVKRRPGQAALRFRQDHGDAERRRRHPGTFLDDFNRTDSAYARWPQRRPGSQWTESSATLFINSQQGEQCRAKGATTSRSCPPWPARTSRRRGRFHLDPGQQPRSPVRPGPALPGCRRELLPRLPAGRRHDRLRISRSRQRGRDDPEPSTFRRPRECAVPSRGRSRALPDLTWASISGNVLTSSIGTRSAPRCPRHDIADNFCAVVDAGSCP